ncbi:MAG: hypothetical protein LUD03_04695, partial [Firmicutes bacterium]|nr:hypothetical protein [Bacillota bacterium]
RFYIFSPLACASGVVLIFSKSETIVSQQSLGQAFLKACEGLGRAAPSSTTHLNKNLYAKNYSEMLVRDCVKKHLKPFEICGIMLCRKIFKEFFVCQDIRNGAP